MRWLRRGSSSTAGFPVLPMRPHRLWQRVRCSMIPMPNATTTAITTGKATSAGITMEKTMNADTTTVRGMSADTTTAKALTAATRREMKAAAVNTGTDRKTL